MEQAESPMAELSSTPTDIKTNHHMKYFKITTALFLFSIASSFAQGLVRTPFLELGSKPVEERQWLHKGNSSTTFYSGSESFDKEVKAEISKQKDQGFKKVDKATFLLASTRALQSTYPVEAGYTYRVIAHFSNPEGTSILRIKDEGGKELAPEMRSDGKGSAFRFEPMSLQIADIPVTQNGTITLEHGIMGDRTIYYANVYLIFKKKI